MEPYRKFSSRMIPLPQENVDTDQIIPARFLKTTEKTGLGKVLFCDWRFDESGNPKPDFALNRPEMAGASILLAGHNFGCGSSREHAPWALTDFGFRALISTTFADIFRNNSLKNGLLPIVVEKAVHAKLFQMVKEDPGVEVTVDLESQALLLPGGESVPFPIDPYSKKCLLQGLDDLGYLLSFSAKIAEHEKNAL
ncbi:MAG: 3-isopropylmalate dehydratase small subunit [Acidobacteria bacterium]|nr:3-isopropylmalate dehydratase small subunit [Acidobacteriota bacterium]